MSNKFNLNGYILGEFDSPIDGKPCVAIATGFKDNTQNSKTGNLIQTFFIRRDIEPHTAFKNGEGFLFVEIAHTLNTITLRKTVLMIAMFLLVDQFYQFIEHIKRDAINI